MRRFLSHTRHATMMAAIIAPTVTDIPIVIFRSILEFVAALGTDESAVFDDSGTRKDDSVGEVVDRA